MESRIPVVLFDTNIFIAALNQLHPHHSATLPWLLRAKRKEILGVISAHTLAELYGYFTGHAKRSPADTRLLFEKDILAHMQVIALTEQEYVDLITHAVSIDLRGAAIFDAIHATVAIKVKADRLLTMNGKHLSKIYPELAIVVPETA